MNNTLREQYPLSPKKFWKKLLQQTFPIIFLFVVAVALFSLTEFGLSFYLFLTLIFLVIMFSFSLYIKSYINRYYYNTDQDFITIKKGVFMPAEIHVQYQKIQDVYVDQDLWDRVLGIYDVHIASATMGSAIEAHIDGVNKENAEGLKNLFLNSIRTGGSSGLSNLGITPGINPQPITVNLSEKFSSTEYPVSSSWVYSKSLSGLFGSIIFAFIITINIFSKGKGSKFFDSLNSDGLSSGIEIFLGIALVIFILNIVYYLIWKSNYKFEFTPEYIFTHKGVISTSDTHTPYSTIQDVVVSQSLFERMFSISTVTIQNAAGGVIMVKGQAVGGSDIKIPGQTAVNANKLADFLKSILGAKRTGKTGL